VLLVCVISFCMLVAAGGMVGVYEKVLKDDADETDVQPADDFDHIADYDHSAHNIAIGLGISGILIIALRLLDTSYYRAKLLPSPFYERLQSFYKEAPEVNRLTLVQACAPRNWPCNPWAQGDDRTASMESHASSSTTVTCAGVQSFHCDG
jgi:hypothetical protein